MGGMTELVATETARGPAMTFGRRTKRGATPRTARGSRSRIAILALLALAAPGWAPEAGAATGSWWNKLYVKRMKVTVSAGATAVLAGYTASLTFNHASLVGAGKSLASGNDVRIAYWNGSSWSELDRMLGSASSWNAAGTTILFRTQATVAASGSDDNYYLYYSFPSAVFPPADPNRVWLQSDGFESRDLEAWVGGWNGYGDSINVVNASVVAPSTGTGADGALGPIALPTNIASVGGVATTVTANPTGRGIRVTSTAGFAAGDEILLINVQGVPNDTDDVGKYEFLRIASVPSATGLLLQTPVRRSYDGASFASQRVLVQRVPQWTTVQVNAGGSLFASPWNGTTGGIVAFRATGTVQVNVGGMIHANALGYRGGTAPSGTVGGANGESYDGYVGSGGDDTVPAGGGGALGTDGGGASSNGGPAAAPFTVSPAGYRGGGGGGGNADGSVASDGAGGGGGGGHGGGGGGGGGGGDSTLPGSGGSGGTTGVGAGGGGSAGDGVVGGAGGNAGSAGGGALATTLAGGYQRTGEGGNGGASGGNGIGAGGGGGGGQYSFADLATRICLGSGGGGGGSHDSGLVVGAPGGAGGGIIFIAADSVTNNGTIAANGTAGTNTFNRRGAGGGGAGGSILIHANSATQSATFTATGGAGGASSGVPADPGGGGGGGGVGRIRLEAGVIGGTTNPTYFNASGRPVHTGNFAATSVTDSTTDPVDIGGFAMGVADFPAQSAIYAEGWFYLSASFPSTNYVTLMQGVSTTPGWQNVLNVTLANDNTLYVYEQQGGGFYPSPTVLTTGAWHRIEAQFVISASAGEAKVWLDGNLEINATGINTGTRNIDRFIFGTFWQGDYTDPNTLFFDDTLVRAVGPAPATALSAEETTAVKLAGFTASGLDSAVSLEWRTASELDNLGFHLYRALSEAGPWTRLTALLVPGLGSSAVGQAYSFRDTGLANGTRYFYRLEDVDASSKTTSHGPVSAMPQAAPVAGEKAGGGAGREQAKRKAATCPEWVLSAYASATGSGGTTASLGCTRYGDPEAVSLGVVSRDKRQATLELRTGGFYALDEPAGGVRVFVPGFDVAQDDQAPALPIRRALVEAVVGRGVRLGGVRALEPARFGLVPSALGRAEMQIGRDGTVRAVRRATRGFSADAPLHFAKRELVKLLPSVFQGERKHAVVELSPLRFDSRSRQLVLARRVLVTLVFAGREPGEVGRGGLGRAPRTDKPVSGEVLVRLHTTRRGLHAVRFEELFPQRSRGLAVSSLRLERQGAAVAFHAEPASDQFGPGSRLYFFAERAARSSDFSSDVAYELVRAKNGLRMPLVSAAPSGDATVSASLGEASFETNRFYQPGLLEAEDLWLWEALASGVTRVRSFPLAGVAAAGSPAATLDVFLQGGSESGAPVDHHVSVSLNGTLVGEGQFAGKKPYRLSLSLPAGLLREGANELQLTNVADTGVTSFVFLDRFMLAHPQASSLAGGRFEGSWIESGTVSVAGLTSSAVLLDVTEATQWLTGYQASGGSIRFDAAAGRRYFVASQEALLAPRVVAPDPSTLRATTNQADYLLIAPRAFLAAAEPLLRRRADAGLTTRAVPFEEIAAEFGHGQGSAEAIRGFLAFAFHSWTRPSPRYVLLLGDSSYDPRNFTGASQPAPLPALWLKTSYLWTASDPQLAAINGEDALPDLAIGRLPATSVEQAQKLVEKLIAWEESGQGLLGRAALVADNPDRAGDFEANVRDIQQSFLTGRSELLLLSELGSAIRPRILDALNSGLSYLSYVGHGGAAVWASENVWNSWDAVSLLAQSQQPLLVTMNCLNGYFVAPTFDSLSESLVKAEGRGAVAAFSPSGLSLDGPAHEYHRALMGELTSGRHDRLGDAILAAQEAYAEAGLMPELVGIYHLLGDPAMPIR